MALPSVSAIGNALRLRTVSIDDKGGSSSRGPAV